jgi:hypothetical protein
MRSTSLSATITMPGDAAHPETYPRIADVGGKRFDDEA